MGTVNPPPPDHPSHLAVISERLDRLSIDELAALGRPNGKPAHFLRVDGDMFVYQVLSKRVPAPHAAAAREMIERGPKAGESKDAYRARLSKEFGEMMTVTTCLSRKTVARNAVARLVQQLKEDASDASEA